MRRSSRSLRASMRSWVSRSMKDVHTYSHNDRRIHRTPSAARTWDCGPRSWIRFFGISPRATVETVLQRPGFFTLTNSCLSGRTLAHSWEGEYPEGRFVVL